MDDDEIALGLARLRALLGESGFGWIGRDFIQEPGDERVAPRSLRLEMLDLLEELHTVLVDAPAMTERLMAETGAERVIFKSDPAENPDSEGSPDDLTIVERADVERRSEIAHRADELIVRMMEIARG